MIKIDRSFIKGLNTNPINMSVVQGIVGLTKAFERQVIAEGVETFALARKTGDRATWLGPAQPPPELRRAASADLRPRQHRAKRL